MESPRQVTWAIVTPSRMQTRLKMAHGTANGELHMQTKSDVNLRFVSILECPTQKLKLMGGGRLHEHYVH